MKNLSEEEILQCLQQRRGKFEVTYEEVTSPNYEVWGRAREWPYNQCVCLLAGLVPITKQHFDLLLGKQSPLAMINVYLYYPIRNVDLNRLQNIDRLLEHFPSILQAKKNDQTIQPKKILELCKNHPDIAPFLPAKLIEVVDSFCSHPSLNLPSTFSSLEINPSALENLKKFKEREIKPLSYNSIFFKENTLPQTPPIPPVPTEPPIEIAKRLFPLKHIERWEKADAFSPNEIVLLHYGIEPEHIYDTPLPGEIIEGTRKEFFDYLHRYFFGDHQWFISQLDEKKLLDLLRRSVHAGSIKLSNGNSILKTDIVPWMESKQLTFPLNNHTDDSSDYSSEKCEISKEEILNYNLRRMDKDQLARLIVRAVAAIRWKDLQQSSLQQIRKHPHLKKFLAIVQEMIGKKEPFDDKTVEDWIRNLNPDYKPKK